jgi:hypothetical protein
MTQNMVAHTLYQAYINTSNLTYNAYYVNIVAGGASGFLAYNCSVLADMDAADTCSFQIAINGSTKTVGVNSSPYTFVSGYLAC